MKKKTELTPDATYHICEAAHLVGVDRSTLLRDAKNGAIQCLTSAKSGRKIFRGRDLIHYRDYVI